MYNTSIIDPNLPTGIEHTRNAVPNFENTASGKIVAFSNYKFFSGVTGEDTKAVSDAWPAFFEYLPLSHIISAITGYELPSAPAIYAFFYPNHPFDNAVTSSHVFLSVKDWSPIKFPPTPTTYQELNVPINSVSTQALPQPQHLVV